MVHVQPGVHHAHRRRRSADAFEQPRGSVVAAQRVSAHRRGCHFQRRRQLTDGLHGQDVVGRRDGEECVQRQVCCVGADCRVEMTDYGTQIGERGPPVSFGIVVHQRDPHRNLVVAAGERPLAERGRHLRVHGHGTDPRDGGGVRKLPQTRGVAGEPRPQETPGPPEDGTALRGQRRLEFLDSAPVGQLDPTERPVPPGDLRQSGRGHPTRRRGRNVVDVRRRHRTALDVVVGHEAVPLGRRRRAIRQRCGFEPGRSLGQLRRRPVRRSLRRVDVPALIQNLGEGLLDCPAVSYDRLRLLDVSSRYQFVCEPEPEHQQKAERARASFPRHGRFLPA